MRTRKLGEFVIIEMEGALNFESAEQLRLTLDHADHASASHFVLDLTQVPFLDSTAIGVMVAGHNRLSDAGGGLRVAGPQRDVARILKAGGLDRYIKVFPTVDQAVAG